MTISASKCVSICLFTGLTFGLTVYVFRKLRQKESKEEIETSTKNGSTESLRNEITYTIVSRAFCECEETNANQSDSYISASSVISSSSSLVTCSSLFSLSDTSVDEEQNRRKKNTICGVELEDEPYSDYTTHQTFETQLSSPVVIEHMQTCVTRPTVVERTQNDMSAGYQEVNKGQQVPIVPAYSDSIKTFYEIREEYNRINTPNSPLTSAYIK